MRAVSSQPEAAWQKKTTCGRVLDRQILKEIEQWTPLISFVSLSEEETMEVDHLLLGVLIAVQGIGIMVTFVQVIKAVRDIHEVTTEVLRTVRGR